MQDNTDNIISPEEDKKTREELYKQNLELARLYKQVDSLNDDLEAANQNLKTLIKQRESLVHLITHKVKGSFTRSKVIFASLLDGTFGPISPAVEEIARRGLDFESEGVRTVDLVLNADNLENGLIRYDMKEIDLRDLVIKSTEDKSLAARSKGLAMHMIIPEYACKIIGDAFWLKEAVSNLIENSIKYTTEGQITVSLEKTGNNILLSVKDTGLGITEEDKEVLFTEGGRGKNSLRVNTDSTGYGLYTVKMIVEAHKGRAWAESEGAGRGSRFYMELPAV